MPSSTLYQLCLNIIQEKGPYLISECCSYGHLCSLFISDLLLWLRSIWRRISSSSISIISLLIWNLELQVFSITLPLHLPAGASFLNRKHSYFSWGTKLVRSRIIEKTSLCVLNTLVCSKCYNFYNILVEIVDLGHYYSELQPVSHS